MKSTEIKKSLSWNHRSERPTTRLRSMCSCTDLREGRKQNTELTTHSIRAAQTKQGKKKRILDDRTWFSPEHAKACQTDKWDGFLSRREPVYSLDRSIDLIARKRCLPYHHVLVLLLTLSACSRTSGTLGFLRLAKLWAVQNTVPNCVCVVW